ARSCPEPAQQHLAEQRVLGEDGRLSLTDPYPHALLVVRYGGELAAVLAGDRGVARDHRVTVAADGFYGEREGRHVDEQGRLGSSRRELRWVSRARDAEPKARCSCGDPRQRQVEGFGRLRGWRCRPGRGAT